MAAFNSAVNDHVGRPTWIAAPETKSQTHCARAGYDALSAGGLPLPANSGAILPGKLGDYLQKLAADPTLNHSWNIERESNDYKQMLFDSWVTMP